MKVTVNKAEVKEIQFPKLMISKDGNIVLFTELDVGTLIKGEVGMNRGGDHYDGWNFENFHDYVGTITLENS